jgi:hypothetical protein
MQWPDLHAWRYLQEKEPVNIVQYYNDHFPNLRAIICPNGIKKRPEPSYTTSLEAFSKGISEEDVSDFYAELREGVTKSGGYSEHSTKAASQSAEPQDTKALLIVHKTQVFRVANNRRRYFGRRHVRKSCPA